MSPSRIAFPVLFFVWLHGGCDLTEGDGDDQEGDLIASVSTSECVAGSKWTGGDEESALMHPGGDCIGCHAREEEGPRFLVAGTVHAFLDEADGCFGVPDATVEIVDAEGRSWSLPTNDAGNFHLSASEGPIAMPYRAAVIIGGVEQAMVSAQRDGSCASCHTAAGANGAAGRVIGPR